MTKVNCPSDPEKPPYVGCKRNKNGVCTLGEITLETVAYEKERSCGNYEAVFR